MRRLIASLTFALVSAVQNFGRNLWLSVAGVVTMTLILVMVGAVLTGSHSVGVLVDQQKTHASKLQIYLQDSLSEASIANYQAHLSADSRIATVAFTNKDQALVVAKQRGDDLEASLQVLGGNPLPASLDVTTKQLNDISAIDQEARSNPLIDRGSKLPTDYNADVTKKLITVSSVVTWIGLALSATFGFISLVIIMVTIRTAVFVRRTEIEIMKLVGATDWFVRWPFILEGVLGGLLAAALSALALYGLYHVFIGLFHTTIFSVPYDSGFLAVLIAFTVAAGAALGGFGSYLGVRRFLSV